MRLKSITTVALMLVSIGAVSAQTQEESAGLPYHDETYGFSMTLPSGWIELPAQQVRAFESQAKRGDDSKEYEYIAIFKSTDESGKPLQLPTLIVQVSPLPRIRPSAAGEDPMMDYIQASLSKQPVGAPSMLNIEVDRERRSYRYDFPPIRIPNSDIQIQARSAAVVSVSATGEFVAVQLNMNATVEQWGGEVGIIFEEIVDSFQADEAATRIAMTVVSTGGVVTTSGTSVGPSYVSVATVAAVLILVGIVVLIVMRTRSAA